MADETGGVRFDDDRAASYDERFIKLSPMKDALHLLTRFAMRGLPDDAHILCVGAGSGAELLYLAEGFPGWRFTALDPATAMLERARMRAEEAGIAGRCDFHQGYLSSLNSPEPFDGATSILVSHFVLDEQDRAAFFAQIAERLKPGAPFVNVDLCWDRQGADFGEVFALWAEAFRFAGTSDEGIENWRQELGTAFALLPPERVARLIEKGGFETAVQMFQSILMHGWATRRA